jgi:hypothetical protein
MASNALAWWQSRGVESLNSMAEASSLARSRAKGAFAAEQINNAYALLLSSQFQRFCRDLHSEAADYIASLAPQSIRTIILARFTEGRKLDSGNPNPGNLGSDFNRFGLEFWAEIEKADPSNHSRRGQLEQLNLWRNAIAHQDFTKPELQGRLGVSLLDVFRWRRACNALTVEFEIVVSTHLQKISGADPW